MSAELAARRTAARAVLGDYTREADTGSTADLALWAARMADMLRHVLAVLDDGDQAAAQFPAAAAQLAEIALVFSAFDWETDDRQYALEAIESIVNGDEAGDDDAADGPEPYCTTCGATAAVFIGHGPDWRHYRGAGTVESPVELYDAGHAPVIGWREAGPR